MVKLFATANVGSLGSKYWNFRISHLKFSLRSNLNYFNMHNFFILYIIQIDLLSYILSSFIWYFQVSLLSIIRHRYLIFRCSSKMPKIGKNRYSSGAIRLHVHPPTTISYVDFHEPQGVYFDIHLVFKRISRFFAFFQRVFKCRLSDFFFNIMKKNENIRKVGSQYCQ